ncbi:LysR substrate-binding domain-containing protein [Paraburkholderia steynii]|uniref:LysR substrate-binding domain-containing protein n=1 Tax=Paraburkholderia steynii TaxID=1245441 RepID=UPI001FCA026C|nr:LysR substrate-binding domain-containing protein [Paraburkholderia steynii]
MKTKNNQHRRKCSYDNRLEASFLTFHPTILAADQVDVALRVGNLPDSSLIAVWLGAIRRIVCASPGYLSTRGVPAKPEDLAEHNAILFDNVSAMSMWSFWSGGDEIRIPIRSRLSVNTIDAAIDAGLAGSGLIRTMS